MPNTLAHIGIQTLCSRAADRGADLKWIAVGCIIPDVPWILQRLLKPWAPDLIDLRLYVMIQASLAFSLLLAGALALAARRPGPVMALLSANVVLHLLLDACQTKWANGVHLLAPLSWDLSNWGLFWPEDWPTWALTLLGAAVLLHGLYRAWRGPRPAELRATPRRLAAMALLLALYFLLPLPLLHAPERTDNHYTATLRQVEGRTGRPIQVDRGRYDPATGAFRLFTGETLRLEPRPRAPAGTMSLQGIFTTPHTVRPLAVHAHAFPRDLATLAGLAGAALLWLLAFLPRAGIINQEH